MLNIIHDKLAGENIAVLRKQRIFCIILGVLLILAGIACLTVPVVSSLIISVITGWLLLFGGVLQCTASIMLREYSKIWTLMLSLLLGLAYIFVGYQFLAHPAMGVLALSLLIGTLFIATGIMRGTVTLVLTPPEEGKVKWVALLTAAMELILGIIIMSGWPVDASFFLAALIGIQLFLIGVSYFSFAALIKKMLASHKSD